MKSVIIIGSGIGGLCTAVRLLSNNYKVTIIEKEEDIGGKINRRKFKDYNFDLTGTILLTPQSYIDLFSYASRDYRDYINLIKLDALYTVNYYDKSKIIFYSDISKMNTILDNLEMGLYDKYVDFIEKYDKKYKIFKENFLDKPMIEIKEIFNYNAIKNMIKLHPLIKSDKTINKIIHNKSIEDYLLFQTMYMGVDPFKNTHLYCSIPAITAKYGLCYIQGGVYSYILGLKKLILELNGTIITNESVKEILIEDNKVQAVKTKENIYKSDIVVCNANYPYTIKTLLKGNNQDTHYNIKNIAKKNYSCSVFIIYLVTNKKYNDLSVHNIYISDKFKNSISGPFNGILSLNPSLYIYCPSRIDKSLCNKDEEMINIMVRVPNLAYNKFNYSKENIRKYSNIIIKTLKNIKGMEDIEEHIKYKDYLTPNELENRFHEMYGNAFGLSHNLFQSTYFRPHLKSKEIKGLYFIGTSTHPGNGISIIIEGSNVLTKLILKDYS